MEDDILFPTAIGCDVHQKTLVCHCKQEVTGTLKNFKATFSTNYNELPKFVDWCSQYKPDTILLESTGIYWCTPFDALEEAHLPVCIVNPAHIKRMIGRKTDTADAEWLAKVGRCGSFIPSYIPTKEYRELRVLSRNITKLTAEMQSYKNRENKFFVEAGYRLHIFSDQFGKAATLAKNMILEGKTPEEIVAAIRASKIKKLKATDEELLDAFHGSMATPIRMAIMDCRDSLASAQEKREKEVDFLVNEVKRLDYKNFHLLLTIPGISELSAATILVEYGGGENFLVHFGNAKRAASWSGMAPGNNESGGKRFSGRSRKGNKTLRRTYCEATQAAIKTKGTTLRSKYESLMCRLGFKRAVFAIGKKLCQLVYTVLRNGAPYRDPSIDYQEISFKKNASRWAKAFFNYMGLEVNFTKKDTGEVVARSNRDVICVSQNLLNLINKKRN